MPQRDHDIYASQPLRDLLSEQAAVLLPELQRCAGEHGLLLCAAAQDQSPALPLLGHWVRLQLSDMRWQGDLGARSDEPLPFVDDAFDLLLLRHAIEGAPMPRDLLEEAIRVLAPGGMLVVSGVHPLSAWAPWFYWRSRGCGLSLALPARLRRWLQRSGLQVEQVQRLGRPWPGVSDRVYGRHALGGGYVLIARKPRRLALPLRLRRQLQRAPAHAGLVSGARRHTAP